MTRLTRHRTVLADGGTLATAWPNSWRWRTEDVAAYQSCSAGLAARAVEG